jgi:dienelactone hydrolase
MDAWRRYDIRLVLQADRGALASRLAHRIHIRVAEDDPYGLGPPVRLLAETMADLGLPMDIVVIPGGGHDLWSDDLREQIHSWMDAAVRARGEASTEPVSH